MTGLELRGNKYTISKIMEVKNSKEGHVARIIIDQFKFQGHSRAELLVTGEDWLKGTVEGAKIVLKMSAPKFTNKWMNGKYENKSFIYPHAKYELVVNEG